MLVWLNGTFGAGKTTTAQELVARLENARLFDPELVGAMPMRYLPDRWLGDFQDWTAWRSLVVATAAAVRAETGQELVAVQTVLREDYWRQLREGLTEQGFEVFHVLLTAQQPALRSRIEAHDPEIIQWRLDHRDRTNSRTMDARRRRPRR